MFVSLLIVFACSSPATPTGGSDDTEPVKHDSEPIIDDTSGGDSPGPTGDTESEPVGLVFTGDRPQNLLLLSIDTLRVDGVGFYGESDATPRLDALIGSGVALMAHRSCSNWTYPSLACVLTGRYNTENGMFPRAVEPYISTPVMLAELLSSEGFTTAVVGSQPLLDAERLGQGYQSYDLTDQYWTAEEVTSRAMAEATHITEGDGPWFLHVHYFDPHMPYTDAPESYRVGEEDLPSVAIPPMDEEWLSQAFPGLYADMSSAERVTALRTIYMLYAAEIRYMDEQIGVFLDHIESLGGLDDTLLVIISDHGEQFYEHGDFEHGAMLFGEETSSMAAFVAPGLETGRVESRTSHIDILPTILDAMEVVVTSESTGAVVGQADPARPVYSNHYNEYGTAQAVESLNTRLIVSWGDGGVGYAGLYNLATDPGERRNLYGKSQERAQSLFDLLGEQSAAMAEINGETAPTWDQLELLEIEIPPPH